MCVSCYIYLMVVSCYILWLCPMLSCDCVLLYLVVVSCYILWLCFVISCGCVLLYLVIVSCYILWLCPVISCNCVLLYLGVVACSIYFSLNKISNFIIFFCYNISIYCTDSVYTILNSTLYTKFNILPSCLLLVAITLSPQGRTIFIAERFSIVAVFTISSKSLYRVAQKQR